MTHMAGTALLITEHMATASSSDPPVANQKARDAGP